MTKAKYRRVLLKLSGEAFGGDDGRGFDAPTLDKISREILSVVKMGVEVAVVVGGGNIWRGREAEARGMDRVTADYAGMLATVINALALQDALERCGQPVRTQTAINISEVAEPYIWRRAVRHMEKGRTVIFAGGTGNPYMTTDTTAALRSVEIGAEVLLMSKNNVDGIYTADPRKEPNAKKFSHLTYIEAINLRLEVMDSTALSFCLDHKLPTIVFDLLAPKSIEKAVCGEQVGTMVTAE
ncbi:UMP kinase [Chloroflexota bacterium]